MFKRIRDAFQILRYGKILDSDIIKARKYLKKQFEKSVYDIPEEKAKEILDLIGEEEK